MRSRQDLISFVSFVSGRRGALHCLRGIGEYARRQPCTMDRSDRANATNNGQISGGDWRCLPCGHWNFARREECKKCGRAQNVDFGYKPPSNETLDPFSEGRIVPITNKTVDGARKPSIYAKLGDGKREGGGGGYKEYDDEEQSRRKQRKLDTKRDTDERKAEKKKCQYCKRFACIC